MKSSKPQADYFAKLKDPRWQALRLKVFERDEFTCKSCGSKEKTLTVHHVRYDRFDHDQCAFVKSVNPWETEIHFLLTLCEACHKERQDAEQNLKVSVMNLPNWKIRVLTEFIGISQPMRVFDAVFAMMEGYLYQYEHETEEQNRTKQEAP